MPDSVCYYVKYSVFVRADEGILVNPAKMLV